MANITTCTKCGCAYEASSEETANDPNERLCFRCYEAKKRFEIAEELLNDLAQ